MQHVRKALAQTGHLYFLSDLAFFINSSLHSVQFPVTVTFLPASQQSLYRHVTSLFPLAKTFNHGFFFKTEAYFVFFLDGYSVLYMAKNLENNAYYRQNNVLNTQLAAFYEQNRLCYESFLRLQMYH